MLDHRMGFKFTVAKLQINLLDGGRSYRLVLTQIWPDDYMTFGRRLVRLMAHEQAQLSQGRWIRIINIY